ncbi:MAG TPA: EAL domain-containing protein [Buttiauxella sp.]|jgi:EAL domain-containing protein (putative c-di-GMP-specific phosphodiesterase class I)
MEKSVDYIVNRVMKHNFDLTVDMMLQPVFDTSTFKCVGCEMLMRGIHRRNHVAPNLFINRLEENGGIVSLGEHVIALAFSYLASAIAPLNHAFSLHVNISPVQLNNAEFAGQVIALSEYYGVQPVRIVLEITDNNILLDEQGLNSALRLREAGFLLAWDDIHSVEILDEKLSRLETDFIKLDRSCFKESSSTETVRIIEAAKAHEVDVIAEGVETFSQMKMLFNNDVKMAQGYLFSRPLDRDSFRKKYLLGEEG